MEPISYSRLLKGVLPIAACVAVAMPYASASAQQTKPGVACSGPQKTEGEGGAAGPTATQAQQTEGEGGSAGLAAIASQKAGVVPCKASIR